MSKNNKLTLVGILVIISIVIGVGIYASSQTSKSNPELLNSKSTANTSVSKVDHSMKGMDQSTMGMEMSAMVKDDQTFIEQMIPHHQEAVNTSEIVIAKTSDPELKKFAQKVIKDQTTEINQMKTWYKAWFNKDYSGTSTTMMGDLNKISVAELDKAYVYGMIEHHKSAIDMANKIQTITLKQEIKTLSASIIASQSAEVITLQGWLMSKYNDHGMMGM